MSLMTSTQSLVLTGNTSFLFERNTIIEYLVKFSNATRRMEWLHNVKRCGFWRFLMLK